MHTGGFCYVHHARWNKAGRPEDDEFDAWLTTQDPLPGLGECRAEVCYLPAMTPTGLCRVHLERFIRDGRPGGAVCLKDQREGLGGALRIADVAEFEGWLAMAKPPFRLGTVTLKGLSPLVTAELQWGLANHAQARRRSTWANTSIQAVANECRRLGIESVFEFVASGCPGLDQSDKTAPEQVRRIFRGIATGLRCIYFTPADTKEAGYIETDHFGRRLKGAVSYFDFTRVPQRWLRDLLWDYVADMLRSPKCPRGRSAVDNPRRAFIELGAFLEIDAPGGGHDPSLLRAEHTQRFIADQRHRLRHGLPFRGPVRGDGKPGVASESTVQQVFLNNRRIMFWALESGTAAEIGLAADFVVAFPAFESGGKRASRNPFTDEVARALANEANLEELAKLDGSDLGLRDIWEAIVYTGRRGGEIVDLRLDCIGHYRKLPFLWHDQTKVGNYNEGIRIPEPLYTRIDIRRQKTLTRFEHRHGRLPTPKERARMALFPTRIRNPHEEESVSYTFFGCAIREWLDALDLGGAVPHQARHTLATKLLAAGASLAHIRRYLGQVSDRMAEHYAKVSHSDLDDLLAAVWVAGPGSVNPGELLSSSETPLSQQEAVALALDLSRRSTPAEGGFCTFQPVVDGGACPWNMDCTNCDKFVLSGADLLYWRRKQEQWQSLAERAPTDEIADYLHAAFEPTARAIAGLEKALAGVGLLDQALALDLRRPQDYFQRIWSISFRADDLAALTEPGDDE